MRQILSLDFDDPAEIDAMREFIRFHSKRLKCTDDKVFLNLAKEFNEQQKIFDYQKEKVKDSERRNKVANESTTSRKRAKASTAA